MTVTFSHGISMIAINFSFLFFPDQAACWILVPWSRIELMLFTMEALSLNHWTAGKVPHYHFYDELMSQVIFHYEKK